MTPYDSKGMHVVTRTAKVVAAFAAMLPLALAWPQLEQHLTDDGVRIARNPFVLLALCFGTGYAATSDVTSVLITFVLVLALTSLLSDVDPRTYFRLGDE